MERSYTILLDRGGRPATRHHRGRGRSAFRQPLEASSRLLDEPPRPAIHREKLTAQELQELAEEPDFVAAAEIMRTRLLSPVAGGALQDSARRAPPSRDRQSWGIAAVGADRSKFTGADVAVALLDTGIDARHPAFRGVDLVERDFSGVGNGDSSGHGTHCAGILFGRNVDGFRIGVAPGIRKALIGKVLEGDRGDSDMLLRGVAWAHEQGAQIVSMSVGFDFAATLRDRIEQGWPGELATSAALESYRANLEIFDCLVQMLAMQEPFTGGAILVAAAGNDSSRSAGGEFVMSACPPAGADRVVSVGSLDPHDNAGGLRVSSFSNCGVVVTAPGRDIVSAAVGGGLRTLSGTSVAAPHVAGVAALWWQAIRQSGLPANATLVRSKVVSRAESAGFSRAVYPSERGAGLAVAPRDGLALTSRLPDGRSQVESARAPREASWRDTGVEAAKARRFEPISVDLEGVRAVSAISRRNLC